MTVIYWLLSRLSPAAIVAIGVFVFYEGVPIIKEIPKAVPIIRYVPAIGPFVDRLALGRVEIERRAGFEAGQAFERAAWAAELARLERDAAEERSRQEAEIAAIERNYLREAARRATAQGHLKEITDDLARNPQTGRRCNVPAVSKRLSTALDAVGR